MLEQNRVNGGPRPNRLPSPIKVRDRTDQYRSADIQDHPLKVVLCTLFLLACEGLSVGFFLWSLSYSWTNTPFIHHNRIDPLVRMNGLLTLIGSVSVSCGIAVLFWVASRNPPIFAMFLGPSARHAARLRIGRTWLFTQRLAPLVLIGFLPLLFNFQLWEKKQLLHLVILTLFGFLGQRAFFVFLRSIPFCELQTRWLRFLSATQRLKDISSALYRSKATICLSVVCLGVTAYTIFFSYYTIINHYGLRTASYDLGIWDNMFWNAAHFNGPILKSAPGTGPDGSHLSRHATFILYLFVPFYALCQRAETLLVLQSAVIGSAAIPLYLFAKKHLGSVAACLIALLYLLYPPIHGPNLFDFHFVPFAPLFLWLVLFAIQEKRYLLATVSAVFFLAVREDVSFGLVIIGLFLILTQKHPIAGLLMAISGAIYFGVIKFVVMPSMGEGETFVNVFAALSTAEDRGFRGIIKTLFSNPAYVLNTLLTREKLEYLMLILAPLAFLPLRRPIGLLLMVPGFLFCLLATDANPFIRISFQYTPHWTTYLFVAIVTHLSWLRNPSHPGDTLGRTRWLSWTLALTISIIAGSYQYGAILQRNTAQAGFGKFTFGLTDRDRQRYQDVQTLLLMVPPMAKIVASEHLVPHLSNRPDAYTLRYRSHDAEYILFEIRTSQVEKEKLREHLRGTPPAFGVVDIKGDFALAKRGYRDDWNGKVLKKMRK